MRKRPSDAPTLVSAVRFRAVAAVCTALALISLAAVLGISVLVDMYTKRQVDLASRVLTYVATTRQDNEGLDPAGLMMALPRNITVVFLDAGVNPIPLPGAGQPRSAEVQHLLTAVESGGDIVDATFEGHPVKARLLHFATVTITDPQTGAARDAHSAIIALGARSGSKLTRVMIAVCVAVSVLMMCAASAAVTVVVRRTMDPLSKLSEQVGALGDRPAVGSLARAPSRAYRESATLRNAIAELIDRRARSEDELREFTANTSHELRTPLTKIQGWSELYFQHRPSITRTERAMRSIVEECDRMRTMLDQLTLLARADSSDPAPIEPVDICTLCRIVVEDISVISPNRAVETAIPVESVFVNGDRDQLIQALRNIMGNSLIHAGGDARLAVRVTTSANLVRIELCDNGSGIPSEHREHVFERFYRASASGGSGLGLSIVRTIIEGHGGSAELQSETGAGTTVTIHLPLAPM